MGSLLITNGKIVTPNTIVEGSLAIENGRIAFIGEVPAYFQADHTIDAEGMHVTPGMIETHCDAIEKEMEPRPNTFFPLDMAMKEMERKLAGNGITTIYHSISLSDGSGIRGDEQSINLMNNIDEHRRSSPSMVRHRIHLRYEVTNRRALPTIQAFIDEKKMDLLSFMDHSPGQGQFKSMDSFHHFTKAFYNITEEEAQRMTEEVLKLKQKVDWDELKQVAQEAYAKGISLASHDDDTVEKIDYMLKDFPVNISEFPITMEAAKHAKDQGLFVSVGAPNIVRGFSHSGNMRAIDAIIAGNANMICSDYHPSALLPAVIEVHRQGIPLPEAMKMVSTYPAESLGIASDRGSIEVGKQADVLLIDLNDTYPAVRQTIVNGNIVYQSQLSMMG